MLNSIVATQGERVRLEQMMKRSTKHRQSQIPRKAADFLRFFPGAFMRVARRTGKSKSHISMVVAGRRTSALVRKAVLEEAGRLARLHGLVSALEFEDAARDGELEEHARR